MDMKYMQIIKLVWCKNVSQQHFYIIKLLTKEEGGILMMKFLAKIAEKYAKSTNTACAILWWLHQPKMPASLIKKD